MIEALLEAAGLKHVDRAGWRRLGLEHPESVAAHSWGVALLVTLLLPEHLDRGRALTYAALHDLAEARVGDITPADGVPRAEKHRREAAAMRALCAAWGPRGEELLAAWQTPKRASCASSTGSTWRSRPACTRSEGSTPPSSLTARTRRSRPPRFAPC